jgi:hypothetical protein
MTDSVAAATKMSAVTRVRIILSRGEIGGLIIERKPGASPNAWKRIPLARGCRASA